MLFISIVASARAREKTLSIDQKEGFRKKHRERVVTDLTQRGQPFEDHIVAKIREYTRNRVVISRRNQLIDIIPTSEYLAHRERYKELINRIDLCLWWEGNPRCGVEVGLRRSFYFNRISQPKCGCSNWGDGSHVSVPIRDLERYVVAHERYPYVDHWIAIGVEDSSPEPVKIFFIRLEEWKTKAFKDYNSALRDNYRQSVICLSKVQHFNFDDWAKVARLPTSSRFGGGVNAG